MFCILSGPEHLFEFVNEAHIKALGFDATGMKVREAQPESVEVHGILDNVYNTGITAPLREIPVTLGTSLRYFDLTYAAKRDAAGNVNGIMILGSEVTNRVLADKKVENALKVRDEFLSIASHELKTPLTSLKLQIQTMLRRIEKELHEEFTLKKLEQIFIKNRNQVDRLVWLVDDMLDLAKVNLGKLTYNLQKQNLADIVNLSCENIKEQFEVKNSVLTFTSHTITAIGNFDGERIEQVVTNILTNAIKYGEGLPVSVELTKRGNTARIKVMDQGPGVKAENFEKIFQKFERVPSSFDISGLGIGLFISKEIVEAHHGKIWVENNQDKGSAFIVELPVE